MSEAGALFKRYVWLIDILRQYKRMSYKEINEKWKQGGLSYGEEDPLPIRTFHNHRAAIRDIFNVYIEIDPDVSGYKYHIENADSLQGDAFRSWLIDLYATLNQLQADRSLEGRVQFEDIPSGGKWLTLFMQAMRENKVVQITHQGFGKEYANTFDIEPYNLKVVQRRWYVIGNNPYYVDYNKRHDKHIPEIRVYGLDRIQSAVMTDKTFVMPHDFDINKFYEGCCGVIPSDDDVEHVVIRAYYHAPDYLRTLPLHESQQELESDEESTLFAYDVKLTYDFMQLIMQQGDQVEVLEPESLRTEMKNLAKTLTSYYKEK